MKKLLGIILLLFIAFPVMAINTPMVTLDVFSSKSSVKSGEKFDIAIRQNIAKNWHTYWLNPGDSGEAMMVTWDKIDGVSMSNIIEPAPIRIEYAPMINFAHKGQPVFIQTITINDDFKGDAINLNGNAMWLVCENICIPESQDISITIPVNNNGASINQSIFKNAKTAIPQQVNWDSNIKKDGDNLIIEINVPSHLHNQMTDVTIFPHDFGLIEITSKTISDIQDDKVIFTQTAGDIDFNNLEKTTFILKTTNNSYEITSSLNSTNITGEKTTHSLLFILVFAFIGGLILNLMPCVFPILSMKALSLVKLSTAERSHAQYNGLAYTAGIILSFLAIAGTLIIFKNAGEAIGWGFQLQNPFVITGLATLLFVIGLNLLGLFEVTGKFTSIGSKLTSNNSLKSSFFTGVLATLVATPCTAPFMASAIGYALTQSAFISLLVFAVLGFGLAFPYLLLTYIPAVQKILPKPGKWMDTFKQALSFPMFMSAIWLIWVLAQQAGDLAIIYILGLFLAITFMVWLFAKISKLFWKVIISVFFIVVFALYGTILSPKDKMNYEPFDQDKLEQLLIENPDQAIFVNMTAAWCITCLVNEQTSLSNAYVKQAFNDNNILYMKGDWTNQDAKITKYLESFGRNGVPIYVFYPASDGNNDRSEPILLPQILTPNIILETITNN